jgi:hypothetical protein
MTFGDGFGGENVTVRHDKGDSLKGLQGYNVETD